MDAKDVARLFSSLSNAEYRGKNQVLPSQDLDWQPKATERKRERRIKYVSIEEVTADFTQAIRQRKLIVFAFALARKMDVVVHCARQLQPMRLEHEEK